MLGEKTIEIQPSRSVAAGRGRQGVRSRVYLSPPHMSGYEMAYVKDAFDTNWIAPLGPNVDAFEREFAAAVGCAHALALNSGTAALHLALVLCGVRPGDEVIVSTLTFAASVNPIIYQGARPVFVDSETASWNMDPALLAETLDARARAGCLPRAVVLVHIFGQCADLTPILSTCARYRVPVVEDAAEALGATYQGHSAGTLGELGLFSFNGNKIITTSGGGMLISNDLDLIVHARKLSTQAREPVPYYEHTEIGYNYRMSNILAGVGRGQLRVLRERIAARRRIYQLYAAGLGDLPGIAFMPEPDWGRSTRWLTCILVDADVFGADREDIRLALEAQDIESRPVWKPMHLQPAFRGYEAVGGAAAEHLFAQGLCLPSGSSLPDEDVERVIGAIRSMARRKPVLTTLSL